MTELVCPVCKSPDGLTLQTDRTVLSVHLMDSADQDKVLYSVTLADGDGTSILFCHNCSWTSPESSDPYHDLIGAP